MKRVILRAAVVALMLWALVYSNEVVPLTAEAFVGIPLYVSLLVSPSLAFWVMLWAINRGTSDHTSNSTLVHLFSSIVGLGVAMTLTQIVHVDRNRSPGLFSLVTSLYMLSGILVLAFVASVPRIRHVILSGGDFILSKLAVGSVLGLWALGVAVHFGFRPVTGQSMIPASVALYFLDAWLLMTLASILLCLLSMRWSQWLFGMASFLGVLIFVLFSAGAGIFFSLLHSGILFWPLVTLVSLLLEAVLFRLSALWRVGPPLPCSFLLASETFNGESGYLADSD